MLQPKIIKQLFRPDVHVPQHLAYVEWFTPFHAQPEPHHLMYKVSRALRDGQRLASIVPVTKITCSAHLFPMFGPNVCRDLTGDTVLDEGSQYLINPYTSRDMFVLSRSNTRII